MNVKIGKIILSAMLLTATSLAAVGQEKEQQFRVWTSQMQSVARNNATLRAAYSQLEAARLANTSGNALPDPEAEVAYMFGSPKGVPHRTNVTVAQTFDWGVLTGRRRLRSMAANSSAEAAYRMEFQRVMGETDAALVRMVYCNRMCSELEGRLRLAVEIAEMYEKRFRDGDINIIELNKVRLNATVAEAELQRVKADRRSVELQLQGLNGGQAVALADTVYPSATALPPLAALKEALPRGAAVQQAQAAVSESEAALRLARVEGLPEFKVGFQGEYIKDNNYSGPSIGLTIPLWGNTRRKVKAARAGHTASLLDLDAVKQQQLMTLDQLYAQAVDLTATAEKLKEGLDTTDTATLLRRSLDEGQMSLVDYLLEQSFYYSARTALLEAERDAQLAVSQLRALMY